MKWKLLITTQNLIVIGDKSCLIVYEEIKQLHTDSLILCSTAISFCTKNARFGIHFILKDSHLKKINGNELHQHNFTNFIKYIIMWTDNL